MTKQFLSWNYTQEKLVHKAKNKVQRKFAHHYEMEQLKCPSTENA